MAQVPEGGGGGGGRHEKKRAKKGSTHIDMTPMVDLAFLLLTFFILTTTMYKPSTLQMTYPVPPDPNDPKPPPTELSNAVTLLLTKKDQIFYYFGEFHTADDGSGKPPTVLARTDFSQVQKLLVERNKQTVMELNALAKEFNDRKITEQEYKAKRSAIKGTPSNMKAIIKTDEDAKYRNMIDMVDEMDISGIGSYGVLDSLKAGERMLLEVEKQKL
ncbi:MAG: biopolymer transporter ExbD [Flavobacteriales bacterium]|nr:biopolymer transporter ExbD [Flavobacteriales bacterium]HRH69425.1 biopolymer transporter ExbD [Flavobacteriales bacterium]